MATTIIELLVEESTLAPAVPPPVGTRELIHNPNMVVNAQNRLISHYRKPRNLAFLAAVVGQVQELEDAAYGLYVLTRLPSAVGINLDVLGRLVGELRTGRVDEDYRAAVRTRILVNHSDGKLEQLIAIVRSLIPGTAVRVAELWPPSLSFAVDDLGEVSFDTMYRLLQQAKAAGVRLEFTSGPVTIGSEDGTVVGGIIGSVDGTVVGFEIASGT